MSETYLYSRAAIEKLTNDSDERIRTIAVTLLQIIDNMFIEIDFESLKGDYKLSIDPDSEEFRKSRKKTKEEIDFDKLLFDFTEGL